MTTVIGCGTGNHCFRQKSKKCQNQLNVYSAVTKDSIPLCPSVKEDLYCDVHSTKEYPPIQSVRLMPLLTTSAPQNAEVYLRKIFSKSSDFSKVSDSERESKFSKIKDCPRKCKGCPRKC